MIRRRAELAGIADVDALVQQIVDVPRLDQLRKGQVDRVLKAIAAADVRARRAPQSRGRRPEPTDSGPPVSVTDDWEVPEL